MASLKRRKPPRLNRRKPSKQFNKIKYVIILLIFSFVLSIPIIFADSNEAGNNETEDNYSVVKVLIFDGDGTIQNSVTGLEDNLKYINSHKIIPNTRFEYSTTEVINSKTLSSYDVLIMPGGDSKTYLNNPNINSGDIKKFVFDGKGYLGICAGAYAASRNIDGYYAGWGIAPHVYTKPLIYKDELQISLTSKGEKILNSSGVQIIYEENGPAIYKNSSYVSMAYFQAKKYQNYAAIVGDSYGSGRVLLSSPHPELNPQKPEMLAQMILWVSKKI